MEVQICLQEDLIRDAPEIPEPERLVAESGISFHKAQAELAQEAGFKTQSELHQRKVREFQVQLEPAPPFPVVSEAEYEVWRLFLPTSYPRREWANYRFDFIPPDVLEVVRRHSRLFDEMEIRTPERMKSDPVIFGTRGGQRYLVARWAESRLIPFEEVVQLALGRMKNPVATVCIYLLSALALGAAVSGFLLSDSVMCIITIIPAIFVMPFFCYLVYDERSKRKRLVNSLALSAHPVTG